MGKFDKFCQSCGMPMDQDSENGGTNQDGYSKSDTYCSYCYEKGAFKDDFTNSKEMAEFVKGKLKEMGQGPLKRWFYTSHIAKLKRWRE